MNIVKKNEVYEKACESLPSSYIQIYALLYIALNNGHKGQNDF